MKNTRRIFSALLLLALAMSLCLAAPASADSGKNEWNGIDWEQDTLLGALFIRGIGVMPVDVPMPWAESAAANTAVCFDSGVTEIPAGFTAGCVNMKTIMLPASMRVIGENVLAVSGGLKEVYYEGTLEGLLSIRMTPTDRAALNGAVFHGSEIVYKGDSFEYVPLKDGESGRMTVKDDGRTITGTLDTGVTYTIIYNAAGQETQADFYNDEYSYHSEYHYNPDGSYWVEITRTDRQTGETVKAKEHHDWLGNLTKVEYTNSRGDFSTEVYNNGQLVTYTVLSAAGDTDESFYQDGKKTRQVIIYKNGIRETILFDDNEEKTSTITEQPNGTVITSQYKNGRLTENETTMADGRRILIQYDENGKKHHSVDIRPNGVRITMDYDSDGDTPLKRVTESADHKTTQTLLYENGSIVKAITGYAPGTMFDGKSGKEMTEESSVVINGEAVDRLVVYADGSRDYSYHAGDDTVTEEYDKDGTLCKVTTRHPDGSYVVTEIGPDGTTITTYYDKDGREVTPHGSPIVP